MEQLNSTATRQTRPEVTEMVFNDLSVSTREICILLTNSQLDRNYYTNHGIGWAMHACMLFFF
jgi:hypothetical protein